MRHLRIGILVWLAGMAAAAPVSSAVAAADALAERIEMLDWTDPERAEEFLGAEPTPVKIRVPDVQMLEVIGMVYSDVGRDADIDAVLARLEADAASGDRDAVLAVHYVRAYSLYQRDQYTQAGTELSQIDVDAISLRSESYRVAVLKGNILRTLGQVEAALPLLEKALDFAREMHDDTRSLHAMLLLARIYTNTGTLERATEPVDGARRLATMLGDEAALVEVEGRVSEIADRQGNRIEERRASIAALDHARRSGSNKWLAQALVNLGDSYLKTHDYAESLRYS
jgi:tetratricopeptide (TPR) repeat protein